MTSGDRLPLLLFQEPVAGKRPRGSFGSPKFNARSRQQVADDLDPKLSRLQQAMDGERIRVQSNAAGVEPEMALVIELATSPGNFSAAARAIGLEWLAEEEIECDPSDAIHPLNPKGERQDKPYRGRLFLTMTDQRALRELLSRWQQWRDRPQAPWPYGETAWRDVFPLIIDIRPWGMEDRLRETGVLEDLAERIDGGQETLPFEAELWFREKAERRATAENEVARLVRELGGRISTRFQLAEIRYHAVIGEIPADAAPRLLTMDDNVELLRCKDIWLFRPVGQCAVPLISLPQDATTTAPPMAEPDETLPPVVALLDGLPLTGHKLLENRLIIDDPDGFETDAPAEHRMHGTSMASLIIHGELDAQGEPLPRRVYCRPIMVPNPTAFHPQEHIPDGTLPVDLVHRAVRRLFEGEGDTDAQAPEVRIINLSIGDPARPFDHSLSPWARLLDWLSYRYNVLFVVSAGNHPQPLDLDLPEGDWLSMDAQAREAAVLRTIRANAHLRRILSPAESVNALTVGAAHSDCCPAGVRAHYHCDPLTAPSFASPLNANGLGFLRAVKPDMLMPGGRQIYEDPVGTRSAQTRINTVGNLGPPGQRTGVPSTTPGELDKTLWFRGTSNAAALATRLGSLLFEMIEALRNASGAESIPKAYDTVLIKALLVHGAHWGGAGERMRRLFQPEVGGRKIKEHIARFLGYGLPEPDRVLGCTDRRATLLGFGSLSDGDAHAFSLPLPPDLSGQRGLRRLTITLAWLSPIAPSQHRHRKARLWFDSDAADSIGVARGTGGYDHHLVKRGTVQHERFEGKEARAFAQDGAIRVQVNCREDAPTLDEPVDYAVVVTLEVGEDVAVSVYSQVRERLRPAVVVVEQ